MDKILYAHIIPDPFFSSLLLKISSNDNFTKVFQCLTISTLSQFSNVQCLNS